jgi:hypothetical protein
VFFGALSSSPFLTPIDAVVVAVGQTADTATPEMNCRCCTGDYHLLTRFVNKEFFKTVYEVVCCRSSVRYSILLVLLFVQLSPVLALSAIYELLMLLAWLLTLGWGFTRCWGWK